MEVLFGNVLFSVLPAVLLSVSYLLLIPNFLFDGLLKN